MKKCSKFKQEKPLNEYNKDSSRKDGISTICKPCRKLVSKERLDKNKEEYFITINVRDCFTLLYKISFSNLLNNINYDIKDIGYWDNLTHRYNIENRFY